VLTISFGVVKAFLDADLLPRVVTSTSAGGIVAALLCTRTDAELKHLLVPELANKITACEDAFGVWIKRWYETGARFSAIKWAEKVRNIILTLSYADLLGYVLHQWVTHLQGGLRAHWTSIECLCCPF
jgi:predicted acylesterase/phospholipase RssA